LIRAKIEEYFKGTPNLAGKVVVETAVKTVDGDIRLDPLDDLETLYERFELERTQSDEEEQAEDVKVGESGEKDQPDINWKAVTDNIDTARHKVEKMNFVQQPLWDTARKAIISRALMPVDQERIKGDTGGSVLSAWTGGAMTLALDQASVKEVRKA